MNIGIIGAGNMGAALGKRWSEKERQVMFSFSRDKEKLKTLGAYNKNYSYAEVNETITANDILMLAVPPDTLPEIFSDASLFKGKIIITCVSGLRPDFKGDTIGLATDLKISMAETIAALLPDSIVVEAFNTTFSQIIENPFSDNQQLPTVFLCGDNEQAKTTVSGLISDCNFVPLDAGILKAARSIETFATAWVQLAAVSNLYPQYGIQILKKE